MNLTIILVGIIAIIFPSYIILTYQKVNNNIRHDEKYRLVDYQQTLLIFWGLTAFIFLNYFSYKQPSLNFYPELSLVNIGLLFLILAFAFFQYKTTRISPNDIIAVKEKLKDVYHYLPKNIKELNWFIFLSISAGICEEIIFRLFLFEFLKENANPIIAFILTNFIFAITHIGSGKKNLISSFTLGMVFSAIYYFTENIWIAIILHIAIDINVGILGYRISQTEKNDSLS